MRRMTETTLCILAPSLVALVSAGRSSSRFEGYRHTVGVQKGEAYLGFDRNEYPGDAALPVLRKTFSFSGYELRR